MDPLVRTYLLWGGLAAFLAVVTWIALGRREEPLAPPLRAGAAIVIAAIIVFVGPGRSRYSASRSNSFSRSVRSAKAASAQEQNLRENAKKALEKSQGSTELLDATTLVNLGNTLHEKGWSSESLPLYDRAYAMFLAKGGGNGDWNLDSWLLQFTANYAEDLKAEGRARESGAILVLDQKLRGLHASKLPR